MPFNSKPLIRWTVGPGHQCGFDVLAFSCNKIMDMYKDRFEYIICHNGLDEDKKKFVENLAPTYAQSTDDKDKIIHDPQGCCWKFYPARLTDSHEILLDNDVVITKPLKEIDDFLKRKNYFLITEARKRRYGQYDKMVPKQNCPLNCGFLGIPPKFNLEQELADIVNFLDKPYKNHWDMQGILAAIVSRHKYIIIKRSVIEVCSVSYKHNLAGYHFVGANKGHTVYWEKFRGGTLL